MTIAPTTPPMPIMFRAIPTYVKGIDRNSRGSFVCDPSATTALTIDLNSSLTKAGIDAAVFDDFRSDGGFSELVLEPGGDYEEIGSLYIRYTTFSPPTVAGVANPPTFTGVNEYELTATYYPPKGQAPFRAFEGKRYHGFRAKVEDWSSSPKVRVRVWPADCGYRADQGVLMTIDLSSAEDCDADAPVPWPSTWGPRITTASPRESDGTAVGALYLSSTAMLSGGLMAPKIPRSLYGAMMPSSCGCDAPALAMRPCEVCRIVEPPAPPPIPRSLEVARPRVIVAGDARARLIVSVSGVHPVTGLVDVQAKLNEGGRLALVESVHGLARVLRQAVDCRPARARRVLDLIGHTAGSDCLLLLGSSLIDLRDSAVAGVFSQLAAERLLPRLGITTLRLLGCRSAWTPAARQTIDGLRNLLRVDVHAVCDLLTANEFESWGFKRTTAYPVATCPEFTLPGAPPTPRPSPGSPPAAPPAEFGPIFEIAVQGSRHAAKADRTVVLVEDPTWWANLVPTIGGEFGVELRGLLARPTTHVIVTRAGGPGGPVPAAYKSFDVFFNDAMVGVYYSDVRRPLFYRVADPARLRALLA